MGEEYFYGYIRDADLDGGYYFFIDKRNPKRKYCLLRRDNGTVHSIWSAEDVDFSDMDLADIPTDLHNGIDFWNDINTYIMEEAGKNSNITDFLLDEFEKDKKDWDVPLIKSYLQRLKEIDGEDLYLDDIYNRVFYDNNEDAFSFLINYNPPHSDDLGSVARRPSFLKALLKDIKENPDNYDEWYCTSLLEEILEYSDVSDKYFDSYLKTLIGKIPNLNQFEFDTFISTFPIETLDNPNFLKILHKSKDLDILTGIVSYITSSNSKDYEIGMRLLKSAIKAGADINGENSKSYEPIPWFYYILQESQYLTRQDIKWLLDNGADPNIKDDMGNTASYYADEEFEDLFSSE